MRRAPGRAAASLILLAAAIAGLFLFGPREPVDPVPDFDAAALPADLDAYLAAREAVVGGIVPGAEKRIVWAGRPGGRTGWAVLYLHGFSATAEELRPLPDLVAKGLGANLYFARLAGHGLGPERFSGPAVNDWMIDVAEALAIGRRIGDRVLVIATSTGGTLAAEAALQPDLAAQIDGIVFISPNFGIRSAAARLLDWPFARLWLPSVAGAERCFAPGNARQRTYWTTCFPTVALLPMAAVVRHAAAADYSGVTVPAYFLYAPQDRIVSAARTREVAERWGRPAAVEEVRLGAGDDANAHVLAGDAFSPSMTHPLAGRILAWARAL